MASLSWLLVNLATATLIIRCLKTLVFPLETSFISRMLLSLDIMATRKQRIVNVSGAEDKKLLVAYEKNEKRWFDTKGGQTGGNHFWRPPMEGGERAICVLSC